MARVEGFTFNGYTVGGSAPTDNTEIVGGRFGWFFHGDEGEETAEFSAEFIITGTTRADLETKCSGMLAKLRTKYQKLSVDWGASNVMTYDPAVANATGWDSKPRVVKSRRRTRSIGFQRGFEFRLIVDLPSNYTDPNLTGNPAAGGRRTSHVAMRWTADNRRAATVSGVFHQVPTKLPRALTTTAALNNPTGPIDTYCVLRLAKIDAGAQWTLVSRSEDDNNQQTVMAFQREYLETISGRYTAAPSIGYLASRQRIVAIQGAFFRTYAATYDGSATRSATTNYLDVATGGYAHAVAQLAALTVAQGGSLVPGQSCELISERAVPNDQDDKLDYTLIFREILFKQSNAAPSGLDDPDVVLDTITYLLEYVPLDDSLFAQAGDGEPDPFKPTPAIAGGGGGKPAATDAPGTLDKSVVPPKDSTDGGKTVSGLQPTKPVFIRISYKATIAKTVNDLRAKWVNDIRPWLLGQWSAELGFSPTYLLVDKFEEDAASNTIGAAVTAIALQGDLIGYTLEEAVDDELGLETDKAATGVPYEYLVQQVFPERRKFRRHTAVFKTGGSFDPSKMLTQPATPGYIVIRRSAPKIATKMTGIANAALGNPLAGPILLSAVSFVEEMLYVARNVGAVGGVPTGAPTSSSNKTVTYSGTNPVQPANPGGQ